MQKQANSLGHVEELVGLGFPDASDQLLKVSHQSASSSW